jgi:hypothetical protein
VIEHIARIRIHLPTVARNGRCSAQGQARFVGPILPGRGGSDSRDLGT